jgi:hypothetical protein
MHEKSAAPQCDLGETASASMGNNVDGSANPINYHVHANQHAPKTKEEIETAARQLADQGYSDHTIAAILKIDVNGIRQMLGERSA